MSQEHEASDASKKIDEAWKDAVAKEAAKTQDASGPLPEVNFGIFITGLMSFGFICPPCGIDLAL